MIMNANDDRKIIEEALTNARYYGLETELFMSAINHIKTFPQASIEEAISVGICDYYIEDVCGFKEQ